MMYYMRHTKTSGGVKKHPYMTCVIYNIISEFPINVILKPCQIIHLSTSSSYYLPIHNV